MFARAKKSGKNNYLQIVESKREGEKVKQRVIATIGRMDVLQAKGNIESLIRSFSRFSEQTLLILSGESDVMADAKKIGPAIVFERLWEQIGIKQAIRNAVSDRKFTFDVERAIFLTVLHKLMKSGSDRSCEKWCTDYKIDGVDELDLHHLYRAMAFLGEVVEDQTGATPFSPRCQKDMIEEDIFFRNSNLFSGLDLVFFDTTSLYFEGEGGETLGERRFSKDHRPDLKQMIVGAVIDNHGRPICCELWPCNTADVKALIPITKRIQERFNIRQFCIVSDRGMISAGTVKTLESPDNMIPYILGVRMRKVKEVKLAALSRGGRYKEIYPYRESKKGPAPLKVKEVTVNGNRYIICVNQRQAFKDIHDRNAIISSLKEQLKKGQKTLIGNKGYRKYLKIEKNSVSIDFEKVKYEARFDGKWVLQTNTDLPTEEVALKYKELGQVERVFRDVKSVLETRPIYHQKDATIRGHVFCSFLALMLRKELLNRLDKSGVYIEWEDIKSDLERLQEITIEEKGKKFAVRSQCTGSSGIVMQAIGVSAPPTIRVL